MSLPFEFQLCPSQVEWKEVEVWKLSAQPSCTLHVALACLYLHLLEFACLPMLCLRPHLPDESLSTTDHQTKEGAMEATAVRKKQLASLIRVTNPIWSPSVDPKRREMGGLSRNLRPSCSYLLGGCATYPLYGPTVRKDWSGPKLGLGS